MNTSDRQVRYAIDKGLIEAHRFEGKGPGAIRVSPESLDAYIERCKITPVEHAPPRKGSPKGKPFRHLKMSVPEDRGSSLES